NRDWPVESAQERREGAAQEKLAQEELGGSEQVAVAGRGPAVRASCCHLRPATCRLRPASWHLLESPFAPAPMPQQMLAVVKPEAAPGAEVREVAVPKFGRTDVLVKVKVASV